VPVNERETDAGGVRNFVMLLLAYRYGLRVSELVRLTVTTPSGAKHALFQAKAIPDDLRKFVDREAVVTGNLYNEFTSTSKYILRANPPSVASAETRGNDRSRRHSVRRRHVFPK